MKTYWIGKLGINLIDYADFRFIL